MITETSKTAVNSQQNDQAKGLSILDGIFILRNKFILCRKLGIPPVDANEKTEK